MKRMCHFIKGNASCETPASLLTFDTESLPVPGGHQERTELHQLRLGVARYVRSTADAESRRATCRFTQPSAFWEFLHRHLSPDRPLYVAAHHFQYDFRLVGGVAWLGRQNPRKWKLAIGQRSTVLSGKVDKCSLYFVDSLNYYPSTLAEVGLGLGLEKLPMPRLTDPDSYWWAYCERDCEIVEAAICRFWHWWRSINGGVCGKTLAQCSFNSWRHGWRESKSGKRQWYPPQLRQHRGKACDVPAGVHDDDNTLALERRAYFGGRVEAYRVGRIAGRHFAVDCNSAYAWAMTGNDQPARLVRRYDRRQVDQLAHLLAQYVVAADVLLDTQDDRFPCKRTGRVQYPTGQFHTSLCGDELAAAYQAGAIVNVWRVSCWERADLFTSWVDYFYQLKQQFADAGNQCFKAQVSALMQSLHGKFAQQSARWFNEPGIPSPHAWGPFILYNAPRQEHIRCLAYSGHTFRIEQDKEAFHSMPIVAAATAARVRSRMFGARLTAGASHVVHEHTDALIVDQVGLDNLQRAGLLHPTRLGAMKLANQGDDLVIHAAGDYTLGGRRVIAGVPRNAREVRPGVYRSRRTATWFEDWARKDADTTMWFDSEVTLYRDRHKRRVSSGGWTRAPVLNELFDPACFFDGTSRFRS
jgi:hypothetical protein